MFAFSFLFQVSTNSKTRIFFSASFLISSVRYSLDLFYFGIIKFLTSVAALLRLLLFLKSSKTLSNFISESSAIADN